MRAAAGAGLLTTLALLSGCGYGLAGLTSVLPQHVETIAVAAFENRTDRPQIEQFLTEEVTAALSRRGRYKVVSEQGRADAVLEGAVTNFRSSPVQFTAEGRATRVEAVISLQATLRDLTNDEVLWSQSDLLFREQYDVPAGGEFFSEQETESLERIARDAAERLVASILEGF